MVEENRLFPRAQLNVRVNYDFNAIAYSKDISEGGICLITEKPIEEGKMLSLVFQLPDRLLPIASLGKVMWCRKAVEYRYEIGISFWDIEEKEQIEINRYLESRKIECAPA